jgi:hypothetical protein
MTPRGIADRVERVGCSHATFVSYYLRKDKRTKISVVHQFEIRNFADH